MNRYKIRLVPMRASLGGVQVIELNACDRTAAINLAIRRAEIMRPGVRYRLHDDEKRSE